MRPILSKSILWSMFAIVVANYIAQIPYYLRLYYFPHHAAPSFPGTTALMVTLLWFLIGFVLLLRGRVVGYWVTLGFLVTETAFYFYNEIASMLHGYGFLFHLANPDPILWTVFAIGYLNMFAGLIFIVVLLLAPRRTAWASTAGSSRSATLR